MNENLSNSKLDYTSGHYNANEFNETFNSKHFRGATFFHLNISYLKILVTYIPFYLP